MWLCVRNRRLYPEDVFQVLAQSRKGAKAVGLLPVRGPAPAQAMLNRESTRPSDRNPRAALRVGGSAGSAEGMLRVLLPEGASRRDTLQEQRST